MSTQMIIGLIVAAGVAVGGGYVYMNSQTNVEADVEMHDEVNTTSDTSGSFTGAGSILDLLRLGQNIQCNFSHTMTEGTPGSVEGTVYIAGDNLRGDYAMKSEGQMIDAHVIHNNGMSYIWGQTPFGEMAYKSTLEADETVSAKAEQGMDLDEDVDYSCRIWSTDSSKFVPPSNINFQDINAQMQQIQAGEAMLQGAQCGACENIPDAAAQAQCKVALGC